MFAIASPSSSSSSKKYDVFLSFRGEDTRRSFTSHLHDALCRGDIKTYIDYELPKGDDISQSLIEAIQDSSISVVVFSQNYATSKWCLNELLEILRCKQHQAQIVVPIFYKIDPSHVRKQNGAYEKAFTEHLEKNSEKAKEWKQALVKIANLAGWDSCNYRDEAELIQNIVTDINKKLNRGSPTTVLENIVGIDENLDQIESLLEEFSTIGIWGMGGMGKTTMAKVVFAKLRSQFDSCCFLENFREESEKHGSKYVRDKLFSALLKDTSLGRLSHRKVLIVLDDVSNTQKLDDLEREAPHLGPGSKVIITSRDKQVLNGRVERIHEAKALSYNNSLELFNHKAFRKHGFKGEYKELVERALAYAQGVPLALTILGSFLYSRTVQQWESALRKLERKADKDIQAVLELSYDGLDDEAKDIFLDIAFFFKGEWGEYVKATLEGSGFHASIGLGILVDKALISFRYGVVWMHDLIQSMAFEIVRKECKNPGGRSRLWNSDEIIDVLKNNQGSDAIQGISLSLSQIKELQLSADSFGKITNLRVLKIYSFTHRRSCVVNLPSGLESFPNSLRYLQWDNFPLKSLPLSICAEKLVELRMPGSCLQKLWDGKQDLVNLRHVNLMESEKLIELPDLSAAKTLKYIELGYCESLCHLHPSILSLPRLKYVDLAHCKNLKSLKTESQSKSLLRLNVARCSGLKEFSFSSDKLTFLCLHTSPVENIDFSMGHMENLWRLSLNGLKLKNLPINDICCMRSLKQLALDYCTGVIDKSKLHSLFDALRYLESLSLRGSCTLTELPDNIKHLSRLQSLDVSYCRDLQSLPELPPSIEELHANSCTSLKTLQFTSHIESPSLADEIMLGSNPRSSVSYLQNLRELSLGGCEQLYELPESIGSLSSLSSLDLSGCEQLYELPESIGSLSSLSSLDLSGSTVASLPASIKYLSNLKDIRLTNCTRLRSLPELLPSTETVFACGCISLEIVPISIPFAPQLKLLLLRDCLKLENCSLSHVTESTYFLMKRLVYTNRGGAVCYPGIKVPKWFGSNERTEASNCITIESPSATNDLIGFIFCCILSRHSYNDDVRCQIYFDGKRCVSSKFGLYADEHLQCYDDENSEFYDDENSESRHVFLWCDPDQSINFHKATDNQNTNYRPKVSFEFSVANFEEKLVDCVIEACGVFPIYASKYHDFIQQMGREPNLGTQKESCHYADENSFHEMLQYVRFSLKQGECGNFEGSTIPEWFTYKSSMTEYGVLRVSVQVAPDFENLIGFIFCFVMPHFSSKERDQCHSSCECNWHDAENSLFFLQGPTGWHYSMEKLNSYDNVFLWYDPLYCEHLLHKLRTEGKGYNEELEFKFEFGDGEIHEWGLYSRDCLIKECGVRPIYVSEYTNFLQQKKVEVSMPKKRHRNIDDDQNRLPSTKKLKDSYIDVIQSIPLNSESKISHYADELLLMLSQLNLESTEKHTHHK
ncbi:disease resistance protein RPS6 [Neltuma alba]|uniref:disease resistance protein RPS6 n=1 Tax=Neltuma alba TaxID=207710 RepID=UPI0010A4AD0C|nr:disease resistance protein RPS6-like [Prosopis alba]